MATQTITPVYARRGNIFQPRATTTPSVLAHAKARPYKDFLTPHLHRRFLAASSLILLPCYLCAVLLSNGGWLWSWFPFGFTGIRTLLLCMPCLGIFIVRVANIHVGERTTTSGFETACQLATSKDTYHALAWHLYSACLFGEVFIWSRGVSGNLGWVDKGKEYERPRVNENPVILRSLYTCLALAQAGLHLYRDYDRIPVPPQEREHAKTAKLSASRLSKPLLKLADNATTIATGAFNLTLAGLVLSTAAYYIFIRNTAWSCAYTIGRILFRHLPPKASPSGLIHLPMLAWQAFSSSFILILLWELSNNIFTIFVAEPPLKKGEPLTSEVKDSAGTIISRSKDPNGSLLNGLKAKKETPRSYAFWELHLVCTSFEARRKTFFSEVDRKDGSTWAQICKLCLDELDAIRTRIKTADAPAEFTDKQKQAELQRQLQQQLIAQRQQQKAPGLPKIANRTIEDADLFSKQKASYAHAIGNFVKDMGQSPGAHNPVTPRAKRAIEWSANKALTKEQRGQLSRRGVSKAVTGYMLDVLKMPIGIPFRQAFARRVCAVVFGVPHSNRANILHAAKSLVKLAVASLKEDEYGQAAKDVPSIVRTFTGVITETQKYVAGAKSDWTDVDFNPELDTSRGVAEVDDLLAVLEGGLEEILLAFGEYAASVGLTKQEIREAKGAAGKTGQEMAVRAQ